MIIRIVTPGADIIEEIDIVDFDVPFLFGLDLMKKHRIQPLVVFDVMQSVEDDWTMPLRYLNGHLYLEWPQATKIYHSMGYDPQLPHGFTSPSDPPHAIIDVYAQNSIESLLNPYPQDPTTANTQTGSANDKTIEGTHRMKHYNPTELMRIHRHFGHITAEKLYNLLRRAQGQAPPNTIDEINKVIKSCQTCTEFSPRPVSFRVRIPDKVLFNHRIIMDLVWLPTRQLGPTTRNRPTLHIVDAGTRFNAARFLPSQSTNAVWNVFLTCWATMYVGMPTSMLVDQGSVFMSDEWHNACDLNGIEIVPTGTESHNSLGAGEAYHAYLRRTYNKIYKDYRNVPEEVLLALSIKAINDCTGPRGLCPTLLVFGTLPQLPNPCKKYHPNVIERHRAAARARYEYEKIVTDERIKMAARKPAPPATNLNYKQGDFVYVYREDLKQHTGPHLIASVHGKNVRLHVGDPLGPRHFNISQIKPAPLPIDTFHSAPSNKIRDIPDIMHTEIIQESDPRASLFDEAKQKELNGLFERGAFKIVLREEVEDNPNIVPSRYVLAIKHGQKDTPPKLKARFVLGGHRDRDKNQIVHDSCTVRAESIRLLIAFASIFNLSLSTADWKQGYIQSKSKLLRKVFIRPRDMELGPQELIQVILPI